MLDALGVPGREVVFIEDTPQNLAPARALGMATILVGAGPASAGQAAAYQAPDILAALRVVLDLEAGV